MYDIWYNMIRRCYYTGDKDYHAYGGRGITVSEDWLFYGNFYRDMYPRPENLTLDRTDNDAGYSKENCAWRSKSEQAFNTRRQWSNTSGIKGVCADRYYWRAYIGRKQLYIGTDFFEACCARKSAEVHRSET